eukprot:scaffold159293_cov36-Tisochrysis_lutea.AAC.1
MAQMMAEPFSGTGLMQQMMGGGRGLLDDRLFHASRGGSGAEFSGGATGSFVSCCSSYSCGGPGGHSISYSSTSRGYHAPGQEVVTETQRQYRDSSGFEKHGVARSVGNRGRSILTERSGDGAERCTDKLFNVDDAEEFDEVWRGHAGATAIDRSQAAFARGNSLGMSERRMLEHSRSSQHAAGARHGPRSYEPVRTRMPNRESPSSRVQSATSASSGRPHSVSSRQSTASSAKHRW